MATKDYSVNIGYPVRTKNYVEPLICGEKAWEKVYDAITNAKKSIHLCFWGLDDNIELIRKSSDISSEPTKRSQYTLYQVLLKKAKEGVKIRLLLWEGAFVISDHLNIRLLGAKGILEVIYQKHPNNLTGTWHQKTIIIDQEIAFISGMNAKELDWDSTEHMVIDLRRAKFDRKQKDRIQIAEKKDYKSLHSPRHDYMVYAEGEVVFDIASNFQERWNYCIEKKIALTAATKISINKKKDAKSAYNAQIIRTFPLDSEIRHKLKEDGILQSYIKAISNAEKYIYIENQYFRSSEIANAIVEAKAKSKNLKVIVVTPPDYSNYDFNAPLNGSTISSYWTTESFNIIQKADKDFVLFYLQSSLIKNNMRIFVPIDLHAKLMIVDDEWYTIGSCNIHDRGLKSDGELNISVQDNSAKELRKKIFTTHLKIECPDNINEAIKIWYDASKENYKLSKTKLIFPEPKSNIFSYKQTGPVIPTTTSITV